jgi:mono/diheme cytochrome c family protein
MVRIALVLAVLLPTLLARGAAAEDGAALFDQNCSICHTLGGPAGGDAPDLKGVTGRLDHAWLVKFVLDPEGVTKSGDAYAAELAKKYGGTVMPPPEGLTAPGVEAILTYIEQRSSAVPPPAQPAPAAASTTVPASTPQDVGRGRDLYSGRVRFANRTPACLSCHDVGAADLAGGTLGPSLVGVTDRLAGVKGLSLWLSSPPTPVMRSIYRAAPLAPDEARALAVFVDSRRGVPISAGSALIRFVGGGIALMVAALVAIGAIWRDRFRSVRRPLVALAHRRTSVGMRLDRRLGFRSGGWR